LLEPIQNVYILTNKNVWFMMRINIRDGTSGLMHASCGQQGHCRHDDLLKSEYFAIISEHLLSFGPTLVHEK